MRLEFHPEAREEFHDAAHWYEERSLLAGDRFVQAMRSAVDAIMADPQRYQQLDGGIHIFRLKKFPFRIYYSHEAASDALVVHAVMHEKRRPDYWRGRISR